MNRKLITGWLLLGLGLLQIGGGWALARAAQPNGVLADPDLVRIHVIANSDSAADQALKLQVRDVVLARLRPAVAGAGSSMEAEAAIRSVLRELEAEAAAVVAEQGFAYPVRVELGRFAFPGKAYDGLYLPAGRYRALRILIGEGKGANFWCLVYPSFCYTIREVQAPGAEPGVQQEGLSQGELAAPVGCPCVCPL